jgi:hypothetical protein
MRQEYFIVNGVGEVDRGHALMALIAAIYRTAKQLPAFNTDDVFARLDGYPEHAFRKATATSKLIAVALRRAQKLGMCRHGDNSSSVGGPVCNHRRKGVWISKIATPLPAFDDRAYNWPTIVR